MHMLKFKPGTAKKLSTIGSPAGAKPTPCDVGAMLPRGPYPSVVSKNLPNMNTFCDLLSEKIVISVYDSFFRNYISIVLLSFIVLSSQSQRLFI